MYDEAHDGDRCNSNHPDCDTRDLERKEIAFLAEIRHCKGSHSEMLSNALEDSELSDVIGTALMKLRQEPNVLHLQVSLANAVLDAVNVEINEAAKDAAGWK